MEAPGQIVLLTQQGKSTLRVTTRQITPFIYLFIYL